MKEATVQPKATAGCSYCWYEVSLKYVSFQLWKFWGNSAWKAGKCVKGHKCTHIFFFFFKEILLYLLFIWHVRFNTFHMLVLHSTAGRTVNCRSNAGNMNEGQKWWACNALPFGSQTTGSGFKWIPGDVWKINKVEKTLVFSESSRTLLTTWKKKTFSSDFQPVSYIATVYPKISTTDSVRCMHVDLLQLGLFHFYYAILFASRMYSRKGKTCLKTAFRKRAWVSLASKTKIIFFKS